MDRKFYLNILIILSFDTTIYAIFGHRLNSSNEWVQSLGSTYLGEGLCSGTYMRLSVKLTGTGVKHEKEKAVCYACKSLILWRTRDDSNVRPSEPQSYG